MKSICLDRGWKVRAGVVLGTEEIEVVKARLVSAGDTSKGKYTMRGSDMNFEIP